MLLRGVVVGVEERLMLHREVVLLARRLAGLGAIIVVLRLEVWGMIIVCFLLLLLWMVLVLLWW